VGLHTGSLSHLEEMIDAFTDPLGNRWATAVPVTRGRTIRISAIAASAGGL